MRVVKQELKVAYKNWVNNDVAYIITKEEKKAFMALTTDEERENFIENFWRRRDPNPDTEENEYREQYYERIAYALPDKTDLIFLLIPQQRSDEPAPFYILRTKVTNHDFAQFAREIRKLHQRERVQRRI